MSLLDPFEGNTIPLREWANVGVRWLVDNYRPLFQEIKAPFDWMLQSLEAGLGSVPPIVMLAVLVITAWQAGGWRLALGTGGSALMIGFLGLWGATMTTMSIIITALVICLLIGLPIGVAAAKSDRFDQALRPILDGMQTIPSFVYLVPVVMLFGIGNVPGVIVTIIYAVPPLIRLTNLGIRQVPPSIVEAAVAFGASPQQVLFKVQIPLAMRTIMAGVNQTLMMSLSMAVIASMIAVGGLGRMVLQGIGRLDMGTAMLGGVGIVLLAIILDRLTQTFGTSQRGASHRRWYQHGPLGVVVRAFGTRG